MLRDVIVLNTASFFYPATRKPLHSDGATFLRFFPVHVVKTHLIVVISRLARKGALLVLSFSYEWMNSRGFLDI